MTDMEKVKIHGVPETMMQTLFARTILLDQMVGAFLEEHPDATVVNIACGLDTRVYRLDNGQVRWYNLDLPEVIDIRRRFLNEHGRISMIAKSAMNESWAEEIEDPTGEVLVVIEGLVMYLTEADVKKILFIICSRFEHAEIIMEIMCPFIMRHRRRNRLRPVSSFYLGSEKREGTGEHSVGAYMDRGCEFGRRDEGTVSCL